MPNVLASLHTYTAMGWRCVPIETRQKRPVIPGWPVLDFVAGDFSNDGNLGVILGVASGGLVDVDLDCEEAVRLAPFALEPTWTFGRKSKPRSHWLYVVPGGVTARRYVDTDVKPTVTMLECRSATTAGEGHALQTVLPPSTHPSGETVTWDAEDCDGTGGPLVTTAARIWERIEKLAVACLYARAGLAAEAEAWLRGDEAPSVGVELLQRRNRLLGVVSTAVMARKASQQKSESLDEAVRNYNQAHPYEWPRSGGQCPVCGHRGCFGSFADTGRWTCHSSGHGEVGVPGKDCYTGDALDIDAHRGRCSRIELLRKEGYL